MANDYIHKAFFRERVDLERAVQNARTSLAHVLEVDELGQVVMSVLERSRRATAAALYLRDPIGFDFERLASFGPEAPGRIERAAGRPLFDRLEHEPSLSLEELHAEAEEARRSGQAVQAEERERLLAAAEVLGPFRGGVCLSLHGEGQALIGILLIADDRVSDAISADEVVLLESLAVQIAVVIENSRQYKRMRERDRLTELGQMAAGLAHEVKNPLGAIKGAAQLLADPQADTALGATEREFVGIILEEVDRLDRVVGSVLDYARPAKGWRAPGCSVHRSPIFSSGTNSRFGAP
jgi:signal transduction histidine kinase